MSIPKQIAENTLLAPAELGLHQLQRVLDQILVKNIDYADLYFQFEQHESWFLEDGIIKEGHFSIDKGVGVRAISGEMTGFAYADDINLKVLEQASSAAKTIAKMGQHSPAIEIASPYTPNLLYPTENPLKSLKDEEKINLLRMIDAEARRQSPYITQVMASLTGVYEVILIMASDGTYATDIRPLVRLNVEVIAEHNGRRERGSMGGGGRFDYLHFLHNNLPQKYAEEAVRSALVNLTAIDAPAGVMPVVLGSGWPGVLLHEAIGHGLEGDFNRKGSSAYSGRMGQQVASSLCTIVDDGTLAQRRGSLSVDDEGTPAQCTVLIENGILKNYMQDKLNARLMGMHPTGNGRRESYAHVTLPRMTNTYMLPGQDNLQDMIASIPKGLYAVNFGGGQVDITSGKFVFSASEAYLIENGKITQPVKGATLIGNGPDVLTKVSMVGHDLALDEGVGTCGKDGQSVPVGVGQPSLKIDGITVGGTL